MYSTILVQGLVGRECEIHPLVLESLGGHRGGRSRGEGRHGAGSGRYVRLPGMFPWAGGTAESRARMGRISRLGAQQVSPMR